MISQHYGRHWLLSCVAAAPALRLPALPARAPPPRGPPWAAAVKSEYLSCGYGVVHGAARSVALEHSPGLGRSSLAGLHRRCGPRLPSGVLGRSAGHPMVRHGRSVTSHHVRPGTPNCGPTQGHRVLASLPGCGRSP